ncbi:unnamed protein product [Ostreobium quekettii]|uniref:Uncharacterized protein n=1 Tax=Ostreobium quekettii TaxID=121088 RepID=A0A8S1IRR2_9CHLO|nr:unnamed protein product [Ostreobium quekettii]
MPLPALSVVFPRELAQGEAPVLGRSCVDFGREASVALRLESRWGAPSSEEPQVLLNVQGDGAMRGGGSEAHMQQSGTATAPFSRLARGDICAGSALEILGSAPALGRTADARGSE